MTGNPCTDYNGYRDYVIATLPQLTKLDGVDIERSERIKAIQQYSELTKIIHDQEHEYLTKQVGMGNHQSSLELWLKYYE